MPSPHTMYVVMGTPRSGTSAVAGVLHHLGIPVAPELPGGRIDSSGPDDWNPRGHFQDATLGNIEDAEMGFYPDPGWQPSEAFITALTKWVAVRSAINTDWGVKSNRIQWYLPLLMSVWGGPVKVITTRRDHGRCIASWRGRIVMDKDLDGENFIMASKDKLAGLVLSNLLIVDYDNLHDDRDNMVSQIATFVGKSTNTDAVDHVDLTLRRY